MRASRMLVCSVAMLLFGAGALYGNVKGTLDAPSNGWYPAGEQLTVTATPDDFYYVAWHGDTDGLETESNTFSFTVDGARHVQAEFKPHVTQEHNVPWWWLAQFAPDNGAGFDESDFEDMVLETLDGGTAPVWQAYLTGTDPQQEDSRFEISKVEFGQNGRVQLRWSHASHADPSLPPVIIEFRENLLEGDWVTVGEMQMEENVVWDHESNGDVRGYYRLRVGTP